MLVRRPRPEDWSAIVPMLSQCFGAPTGAWDTFRARIGDDGFRVAEMGGRLAGALGVYPLGQWFGGRSVPMGGIAAVGVAPEHRADGVAAAMMRATLRELREAGVPLATLYASSQHVYRSVGFELAGNQVFYAVPLGAIGRFDRGLRLRPTQGWAELAALHVPRHGNLDRSPAMWDRKVAPYDTQTWSYVAEDEGYIVISQPKTPDGHYNVFVHDWCARTPRAAHRLWAFLADHRSFGREARWVGPASDPMVLLLPEASWRVERFERWLLRLCDLPAALSGRGWPEVRGEVGFEVTDAVVPENAGRWTLTVEGGRAEVTRGGDGAVKLDIRAFAPLYSGLCEPRALAAVGWIEAPEEALRVLTRLFASPEPWMMDGF